MNKCGEFMLTNKPDEETSEITRLVESTTMAPNNKKRRTTNLLIMIGVVVAIGLYFLNSYWHPFWRYQSGYVSEAQFGEDWPFTVSEARVVCLGAYDMILETRAGVFGLTSNSLRIGYKSLEDSNIWKWDQSGLNHRVAADKFWLYVNTLCK